MEPITGEDPKVAAAFEEWRRSVEEREANRRRRLAEKDRESNTVFAFILGTILVPVMCLVLQAYGILPLK